MEHRTEFIEITEAIPRKREQRFSWMINTLLKSRVKSGLETGINRSDEDVNMYLADLLCRYSETPTMDSRGEMIFPHETSLYESIKDIQDNRTKYMTYRFNADHLLITLGIFGNAWLRGPRQTSFHWAPTREECIGRGKWYYGKAAIYATRLEDGRKGFDDLLAKLDTGFEEYLTILETMRGEYFNLIRKFSNMEWQQFCSSLGINSDP
jgi:hypothetical protein